MNQKTDPYIGKTFRMVWWHENEYIYSAVRDSGYAVYSMLNDNGLQSNLIPYDTHVKIHARSVSSPSKYEASYTIGGEVYYGFIRRQWLSNRLITPQVGDMVKTRQAWLHGVPEIPEERPHEWRGNKKKILLRDRRDRSPVWLVIGSSRGFLQLNTGTWVSCGDVYIPSQIKNMKP